VHSRLPTIRRIQKGCNVHWAILYNPAGLSPSQAFVSSPGQGYITIKAMQNMTFQKHKSNPLNTGMQITIHNALHTGDPRTVPLILLENTDEGEMPCIKYNFP